MPDDIRDGITFDTNKTNEPSADDGETSVAETLADRVGRGGETAPLGDPDAPQGSGPETDMSKPENRPAPAGKIRFADADPRSQQ